MGLKLCPLCGQRRPKRACPALGQLICSVCCGTKRQTEIDCPPGCAYLSSAQAHPAAAVQRKRERDFRFLLPLVRDLTDAQYPLLLGCQALILKHSAISIPAVLDLDVREAAGTLASTLETAGKGIIYEHQTASLPAQRLSTELRTLVSELAREGAAGRVERDAAVVLRRIEQGARAASGAFPEDGDRAYLKFLGRMMSAPAEAADAAAEQQPRSLIIPP